MPLQLHNAMWPGIVGKGTPDLPVIPLQRMIDLTAQARVQDQGFDGIDLNLVSPHINIEAGEKEIAGFANELTARGLKIGSIGAPVWPESGGGSAMGSSEDRKRFVAAVRKTCEYAKVLNKLGIRSYGIIRIDSADTPAAWSKDERGNTKKIASTFREAAQVAAGYGERLAAEGEICWAGMHSWKHMLDLLEEVGLPGQLGFQADLAHTYLFLLGHNAPGHALLRAPYSDDQFWVAYAKMTSALAPWTYDVHVAQSNGTVFGSGSHDKTGRHVPVDAPYGKLDIVRCARYWLLDAGGQLRNGIRHVCWDGCMFPNEVLESGKTWQKVLEKLLQVREDISSRLVNQKLSA
jgi:sugar phosphate isomerase/epimerase